MLPPRMQAMQRVFGAIVALSSLVAVPPLLLSWWWKETTEVAFLESQCCEHRFDNRNVFRLATV